MGSAMVNVVHAGIVGGNVRFKAEPNEQVALAAVVLRSMINGNGSTMTHMSLLMDCLRLADIESAEIPDVKTIEEGRYCKLLDAFMTNMSPYERSYRGGVWTLTEAGVDHCVRTIAISNEIDPETTLALLGALNLDSDSTLARGRKVLSLEANRIGLTSSEIGDDGLKRLAMHIAREGHPLFDIY